MWKSKNTSFKCSWIPAAENKEHIKQLGFKVTEKEKTLPFMYCIFKMDKNPIGQVSSQHLKFALQSKSEMLSDVGGGGLVSVLDV